MKLSGAGGDQRPLTPPEGRDLYYARLLFEALWRDASPAGRRFTIESEELYLYWRRLVKGIIAFNGGISPLGAIKDTQRDLELQACNHRSQAYPKPRALTAEENACLQWRTALANDTCREIYLNLGCPSDQPFDWDGTQEPWKTWSEASSFLSKWGNEPAYNANPHVKQKRWRRRTIIFEYLQAVLDFCESWRLKAWWAVPAIVHYHFTRAQNESNWDLRITPLGMYAIDPGWPASLPIMVKLPGRTEEQFNRDKTKAFSRVESTILEGSGGPIQVLRTHFSREDWTDWEKTADAACVLLDWDGHPDVSLKNGGRTVAKEGAPRGATPGNYLVDRCQERLGRHLSYREQRNVRSQAFAQVRDYRSKLRSADWSSSGNGNHKLVARRIARSLLDPGVSWVKLAPINSSAKSKNQYGTFQSIQRACVNFARLANLELPSKPRGRKQGSRNSYDPAQW